MAATTSVSLFCSFISPAGEAQPLVLHFTPRSGKACGQAWSPASSSEQQQPKCWDSCSARAHAPGCHTAVQHKPGTGKMWPGPPWPQQRSHGLQHGCSSLPVGGPSAPSSGFGLSSLSLLDTFLPDSCLTVQLAMVCDQLPSPAQASVAIQTTVRTGHQPAPSPASLQHRDPQPPPVAMETGSLGPQPH